MENYSNITTNIIDAINTILGNLFSSIDNNIYNVLDDVTFISSDIIADSYFEKILGTSTSNGILLISNSLLLPKSILKIKVSAPIVPFILKLLTVKLSKHIQIAKELS